MDFHVCQCDLVFILCPLSTGIDVQMVIPETYIYIYIYQWYTIEYKYFAEIFQETLVLPRIRMEITGY